jgi:oligoendopeptidase F
LKDLKKDIDKLYDFLVKNKQATKPAEKKKLIQALKDMDADSIDVSDFSPTQLVLEDIIEMMCQLNWLFGNKSLIQIRNRFSRAIKEGTAKKQIPKFITDFEGEYSTIREQLVKVTKDKINNMIESEKSITHYDRLVRKNYKTADFFGRMVDIGVLRRA